MTAMTERQAAYLDNLIKARFTEGSHDFGQWQHWINLGKITKENFGKAKAELEKSPLLFVPLDAKIKAVSARIPVSDTQDNTYFAFPGEQSDGEVKFYCLSRPTSGTWAGRIFLSAQGSDELYAIRNDASKLDILTRLADNYTEGVTLYGHTIGHCGICNRTLTDAESRARGIGPDCAKKVF